VSNEQWIIDTDVHHRWHQEADLIAYLDPQWQPLVDRTKSAMEVEVAATMFPHMTGTGKRLETFPSTGGPPGSDYQMMREQLLDAFSIEGIVLSFDIGTSSGVSNPFFASALCRAANDWSLDRWIDANDDERLWQAGLIPTQIPEDGATEIRRLADNPKVVEALLISNGIGRPFGHPVYDPIFDAAQECGLPVAIHNGGDNWAAASHGNAGGIPNTRYEFHSLAAQAPIAHLASFITFGVFEKFPDLKLLIVEAGVAWLPWLIWSLDRHYESMRLENPLIARLPSEVIRQHVVVTTQPIEVTRNRNQLIEALEAVDGISEILAYSSDYPHWDGDDPTYVARRLPKSWAPGLFRENARRILRCPPELAAIGGSKKAPPNGLAQ
jgi:predicted TIM-barrel fold metal-dependent hydrolase